MLFNTLSFAVFAALFFLGWPLARKWPIARYSYIVGFSLLFYGWTNPWNIGILLLCVSVDFFAGLLMAAQPERRKLWLFLSIGTNLAVLAFFKYAFFLANGVLATVPVEALRNVPPPHELPLGISFFTFQSMTYAIDIYRGKITPTRSYLHYLAFTTMFPHLLAGPIVRAKDLLPQLETVPSVTWADRREGLWRIMVGLFRKVVIADNLAPAVTAAFAGGVSVQSGAYWWLIMLMFAIQLYCDFSGYSEIARGLAKWMGYGFPVNFAQPFQSTSFKELWMRWHMSLSSWFRDYVYLPLGRAHKGEFRTHLHIILTFALSGMWHGAGWNFLLWGLWNGLLLSFERLTHWNAKVEKIPVVGRGLANFTVFAALIFGLVAFRAPALEQTWFVTGQMLSPATWTNPLSQIDSSALLVLGLCLGWHAVTFALRGRVIPDSRMVWPNRLAFVGTAICIVLVRGPGQTYVYFQF